MQRPSGAGRQPPPRASSSGLNNHFTVESVLEKSNFNFSIHTFSSSIACVCVQGLAEQHFISVLELVRVGICSLWEVYMGMEVQRIQGTAWGWPEGPHGGGCILHRKHCNLLHHCLEQDYPICDLPESILSPCFTPWSLPHSLAPWPEEEGIGEGSWFIFQQSAWLMGQKHCVNETEVKSRSPRWAS